MRFFASLGIVIFAMLILCFLKLIPGVFAIFYHHALGKFSHAKAADFALFFILGTETISACLFLSIYFLTCFLLFDRSYLFGGVMDWILAGICLALAGISLYGYFRRGSGAKLFIPRKYATSLGESATTIKTRSDAFTLGAFAGTCELLFTLPLYVIVSLVIISLSSTGAMANTFAILYVVTPTLPLFDILWRYHSGQNLADILKSRFASKTFTRFVLSLSYFLIAILIIYLGG